MQLNFCRKALAQRKHPASQFILIMKLTVLFLTIAILHVSAASFAQKITLSGQNQTLVTALESIHQQSGYALFYDKTLVKQAGNVNVSFKELSLDEAMSAVLKDKPFTYTIIDKTIVIKQKVPTVLDKIKAVLTPPTDVIGRVTNTHGQPLNGATVAIKRTQTGTLSDANGNFTVRGVLPSDTLVFSYLGYKRQFIKVGEQKDLKIVLEEATNQLDQVVIQAYGQTSQRLTTGDIGKVTSAQIEKQSSMNPLEALQGQVAGVVVTNTSGYASGSVKVEIRGRNTISPFFSSDPMYIVDGVPLTILNITNSESYATGSQGVIQSSLTSPANGQSPFFGLNPADIASIEVLKDADATAIYGSRASNGVILITTKKGKAGKTHLDLNVSEGISNTPRYYQMLNTQQYVSMREEALKNDGLPVDINNAPDLVAWGTTRYTDWQKFLWGGPGQLTDAQASLSGGDALTTFRIGMGYNYQKELTATTGNNNRASLSFDIDRKSPDQRFQVDLSGNYSITQSNLIYLPGSITIPPNAPPVYAPNGKLNFAGWVPLDGSFPFGPLLQPYLSKTNNVNLDMNLSYELYKGLQVKANVGYNNIQNSQVYTLPIASQDPAFDPTGSTFAGISLAHNLIIEPQLEYNRIISKGKLNALVGGSYQGNITSAVSASGYGITNDALLSSVGNAPGQFANTSEGQYKYIAGFARLNYNWEDKYILNLNARRDGSTRFAPGRQFGNFGSVGGAWIFTEENWFKKHDAVLSFGKIRASYGTTGGDQIPDYQYLSQWSFGKFTYNNTLPLNPTGHSDSLIHWQVNKKAEIAIDLGFFKDRLTIEIDGYRNRCSDQLTRFPTALITGFNGVTSNLPATVENKGYEINFNGKLINTESFSWTMNFHIGVNRNKLIAYPNLIESPYRDIFVVGQPLNIIKVLHVTGVDPLTGLYAFQDVNKDGSITIDRSDLTSDDRHIIDISPKFDGGLTTNLTYKNFDLSIFFYFKKQMGINPLFSFTPPGDVANQPVEVLGRWKNPGDIATAAKFTTQPGDQSYTNFFQYSDGTYTDASFIRLENLSLSYNLTSLFNKKAGITNFKVFLKGDNLFIITKYKGLDPEVQIINAPPRPRFISAGLSCNF